MRSFEVLAWAETSSFVLYVPEIEALTRAGELRDIEPAARDLIAELLGLEPNSFQVTIQFRRPRT